MNKVSKNQEVEELGGNVEKGFGKLIGNEELDAAGEPCQLAKTESGAVGWVLLWVLGIPLPILLIVYLVLR